MLGFAIGWRRVTIGLCEVTVFLDRHALRLNKIARGWVTRLLARSGK